MKKILWALLLGAFFAACASDDKEDGPLVTDIVEFSLLPADPGMEMGVMAKGFVESDDIFIRQDKSLIRAYVTHVEYSVIRFVVPGSLPAGRAEVLLMRGGKTMVLGTVDLSDGLPPEEFSLYGIGYGDDGTTFIRRARDTGDALRTFDLVASLWPGQRLSCATNVPGTNRICGVNDASGVRSLAGYDLTMKRFMTFRPGSGAVAAGKGLPTANALCEYDANSLLLVDYGESGHIETRVQLAAPYWRLPAGVTYAMLSRYPYVYTDGYFLLTAAVSDDMYAPLLLDTRSGRLEAKLLDKEQADAMVPFRVRLPSPTLQRMVFVVGYAISKEGVTRLNLFNAASGPLFAEVAGEIPGTALSCTLFPDEQGDSTLYVLCRVEGGTRIYTCGLAADDSGYTVTATPWTDTISSYDLSEIVAAR